MTSALPFVAALPVLETERLILRAPTLADHPACEAFLMSGRSRFVGGPVADRWQAWKAFAHLGSSWLFRDAGIFVLERRDSGAAIGCGGPWQPVTWPEAELSWSIWDPAAEGKGYMIEAMRRIHAWVFNVLGWTTAVSYIDRQNLRSAALARRLGAAVDPAADLPAEPRGLDDTVEVWRHTRGAA